MSQQAGTRRPSSCEGHGEIERGGGLGDAALLVGECDHLGSGRHGSSSASIEEDIRGCIRITARDSFRSCGYPAATLELAFSSSGGRPRLRTTADLRDRQGGRGQVDRGRRARVGGRPPRAAHDRRRDGQAATGLQHLFEPSSRERRDRAVREEVELVPRTCSPSPSTPERAHGGVPAGQDRPARSGGRLHPAVPGLRRDGHAWDEELLSIGKVWELAQFERRTRDAEPYDLVIVDAPATGHGLGILRTPRTYFAEIARVGPIAHQGGQIAWTIADRSFTAVVAVSTPEEMPVNETLALHEAVLEDKLDLDLVIVNARYPRALLLHAGDASKRLLLREPDTTPGALGAAGRGLARHGPAPAAARPSSRASASAEGLFGDRLLTLPYLFCSGDRRRGARSSWPTQPGGAPCLVNIPELLEWQAGVRGAAAGGVGKTTTSAVDRRWAWPPEVCARWPRVTIDPARRLANALGLEELENQPRQVPPERLQAHGLEVEGELWAMMLDPKVVLLDGGRSERGSPRAPSAPRRSRPTACTASCPPPCRALRSSPPSPSCTN